MPRSITLSLESYTGLGTLFTPLGGLHSIPSAIIAILALNRGLLSWRVKSGGV
jgi:hypothetical protein